MAKSWIVAVVLAYSLAMAVMAQRAPSLLGSGAGVMRTCSNEDLWTIKYNGDQQVMTPYSSTKSAERWYNYKVGDKESTKDWFYADGRMQVLVYKDKISGASSVMFFNKARTGADGLLQVRVKDLPGDYEVTVLDDPSDVHKVTNQGTGAKLTWTLDAGEGDGGAITIGDSCITIKLEQSAGVHKVAFLSRGSSPAMTVNAVNKSKYTLCPVPACASPSPLPPSPTDAPAAPTAAPSQQLWVDRHNHYRKMVNVPNTSWDPIIAAHAQKWADELQKKGCNNLVHSSGDFRRQTKYGYLGENLYYAGVWSSNPNYVKDWSGVAGDASYGWGEELEDYRFGAVGESCTKKYADKMIGHYTAMVWRTSTLLGCGVAYCTARDGGWYIQRAVAVCHYGAPEDCSGAMCLNNVRGYYPFCAQERPYLNDGSRMPMCSGTSPTAGCN